MPEDSTELPVGRGSEQSRHVTLLRVGHEQRWWRYESRNEPGYVDRNGRDYRGVTYTLVLPKRGEELIDHGAPEADQADVAARERVLLAEEVYGYVLRAAEERDAVAKIAYREGLLPGR